MSNSMNMSATQSMALFKVYIVRIFNTITFSEIGYGIMLFIIIETLPAPPFISKNGNAFCFKYCQSLPALSP